MYLALRFFIYQAIHATCHFLYRIFCHIVCLWPLKDLCFAALPLPLLPEPRAFDMCYIYMHIHIHFHGFVSCTVCSVTKGDKWNKSKKLPIVQRTALVGPVVG